MLLENDAEVASNAPVNVVAVTTPVNLPSPPTSSFDDGSVDPIPTFPPEFCETPPVPD